MRILVVDDDRAFIDIARYILEREGHTVTIFYEGEKAIESFNRVQPHMVVSDLYIDNFYGLDVVRLIRMNSTVPIMIVTSRVLTLEEEVRGINMGVDLFMSKPLEPKKFLAYVNALLRRASYAAESFSGPLDSYAPSSSTLMRKDLVLDLEAYEVYKNGQAIPLTNTEFRLLHLLMSNPGRVLKPEVICERLWGVDDSECVKILKTHVSRLRQKLGDDARQPSYVATIVGSGYVFRADKEKTDSEGTTTTTRAFAS